MFIGGLLGMSAGIGAAGSLGANLGKAALARVVGGKGAGRQFLRNELGMGDEVSPEETPMSEESSDPSGDITIRITKGGQIIQDAKRGAKVKKRKKKWRVRKKK